jgi:hypothetical protein
MKDSGTRDLQVDSYHIQVKAVKEDMKYRFLSIIVDGCEWMMDVVGGVPVRKYLSYF